MLWKGKNLKYIECYFNTYEFIIPLFTENKLLYLKLYLRKWFVVDCKNGEFIQHLLLGDGRCTKPFNTISQGLTNWRKPGSKNRRKL